MAFLAVGASPAECRLIEAWRDGVRPSAVGREHGRVIQVPEPRADETLWPALVAELEAASDELVLVPVRVCWLPPERGGRRTVRIIDLVMGNPRRPPPRRQDRLSRIPDRFEIVLGDPATVGALRSRWDDAGRGYPAGPSAFARFVVRRGVLALERAEYRLIGAEYKVPRLVREQITETARFHTLVQDLATSLGRPLADVTRDAQGFLTEMVAGSSRLFIDLTQQFSRAVYRQGYDPAIDVDPAQVERVRADMNRYPAVVLPSHRSNLDAIVMPAVLHEHHLPRTHTFGGINMAIWPIGTVFRLGGTIFIRRSADDPVYKAMLREYVGYLMEKRFSLQWYIEGGRSRTGKLLAPKLGLLTYVVDAYRQGRTDDVAFVPASIAYDQFHDVRDYALEASGRPKQPENLAWMIRYIRSQRQNFGRIYVRFAEPILLSDFLGTPENAQAMGRDESRLAMQKLGLEVGRRINTVTPITSVALMTLALLATDGRPRTLDEIAAAVAHPLQHALRRRLPMTASAAELDTIDGVKRTLDELMRHRVVKAHEGPETLYHIGAEQHVAASYYRNTIVHFFVVPAIVELALVSTSETTGDDDLIQVAAAHAARIRDLLKFDLFFEDRAHYLKSVRDELEAVAPDWEVLLKTREGLRTLIDSLPVIWSPAVVRPLFEAYWVVADALARQAVVGPFDEQHFLSTVPDLGRYGLLRGWIRSPDAVSSHLFRAALDLARHHKLTDNEAADVLERRRDFARELAALLDRIDDLEAVGAGRGDPDRQRPVRGRLR